MQYADPKTLTVHPSAEAIPNLTPAQHMALAASIKEHGILQPLLVDGDGRVIDGKHRLGIAQQLKLPSVPVAAAPEDSNATLLAVESAVARRNLTASGRVLILYLAHPALDRGGADRRKANLKRGAKLPDPITIGSEELGEFANFRVLAERYGLDEDYFSKLAQIHAQADAEAWVYVQRRILEGEISIPRLVAGEAGKAMTKGQKKIPVQFHKLAQRTAVSLANLFAEWPRIKWPAAHQGYRETAIKNIEKAFAAMPDELQYILADSMRSWPEGSRVKILRSIQDTLKKAERRA